MSNSQNAKDLRQGQDAQQARPNHIEHNKRAADNQVTQTNEPRRTPESRSDRESQVGGSNQSQARRGGR
jgi:hypothetical protein